MKWDESPSREGRLLGYTNVYAPILDVGRDQRWGRYEEVYGESPYLVGELGGADDTRNADKFPGSIDRKAFRCLFEQQGGARGHVPRGPSDGAS